MDKLGLWLLCKIKMNFGVLFLDSPQLRNKSKRKVVKYKNSED